MCISQYMCKQQVSPLRVCGFVIHASSDCIVAVNKFLKFGEVQSGPIVATINNSGHGMGVGILDAPGYVM